VVMVLEGVFFAWVLGWREASGRSSA
jgi:hypothetical protein